MADLTQLKTAVESFEAARNARVEAEAALQALDDQREMLEQQATAAVVKLSDLGVAEDGAFEALKSAVLALDPTPETPATPATPNTQAEA